MPSGVYKRSDKHKEKVRKYWKEYYANGGISPKKGKHHSIETRKRMSIAKKKNPVRYWLGRKMSDDLRKKLSESHKGHKHTKETLIILSKINQGKVFSSETRKKISEGKKGENNPMFVRPKELHWCWKGGVTNLHQLIRHCYKYREWRNNIFRRDNYTCRECGDKSVKGNPVYLEAHHTPKKFIEILEDYGIKTLEQALICEELWNVDNGKTYCKKCHDITKRSIIVS